MKIALTGGIACGKSTLAKFLRELGIRLLDADDIVHDLEGPGGEAVQEIAARFGESVLKEDGAIDRRRLADIVFQSEDARHDLESILFPRVRDCLLRFAEGMGTENGPTEPLNDEGFSKVGSRFRISVIPLLFESHWEGDYDTIIAIVSPPGQQVDRMIQTRGYTREQAEARLTAQMSALEKASRSDFVVINDSTPQHLKEEAIRLLTWLIERQENEH